MLTERNLLSLGLELPPPFALPEEVAASQASTVGQVVMTRCLESEYEAWTGLLRDAYRPRRDATLAALGRCSPPPFKDAAERGLFRLGHGPQDFDARALLEPYRFRPWLRLLSRASAAELLSPELLRCR